MNKQDYWLVMAVCGVATTAFGLVFAILISPWLAVLLVCVPPIIVGLTMLMLFGIRHEE